jgi:DNA-directed RNA polymerase subunit RPC12/RpoP
MEETSEPLQQPQIKKPTTEEILQYQVKTRPSIWAQYYTKLRGKDYRFEQILANGQYDMRTAKEIPMGSKGIGLRGQRQFLQQILDDQHPHKSTQKSRQCGISENEVREALWFGDQHPYTKLAYVFPTFDQVADFSKTRIEEVMKDSDYVKRRMGIDPATGKRLQGEDIVDNVRLRRIGNSFMFFRSGHTAKAGEGIDVDLVVFDEIDRMAPNVMIAFSEALSSSAYGYRRDVSTPSLPGVGVNASFRESNQNHWFMKCPHCGHWFTMIHDFPKGIVDLSKDSKGRPNHKLHLKYSWIREEDTHMYVCMNCNEPISDETRIKGIWRALYPHKTAVSGYQISQLFCPWISASQLMKKKNDYNLDQLFENYVIGRPYLGDNVMITKGDILRCIDTSIKSPYDFRREHVCIGVDWGNKSWGIAAMHDTANAEKIILLDIWNVGDDEAEEKDGRKNNPHIQRTGEKMRQWQAVRGVFDAGYGKDRNFELMQDFPGKVFSCFYPNLSSTNTTKVNDIWSENDAKVSVDRTMTLKVMAKLFRDGKIVIPLWVAQNPLFETFTQHLTNLVLIRDIDEDEKTKKEVITERVGTLPGGDHFGHAMNYLSIALRKVETNGGSDFFF